ncbi:relaxase/mobilization nuclease domain-containing protein [Paenarthrobacter histidinolovorans]|uniref:MobA/VirD2-like nuclease domain-containing protein n=1 Tax=Paenarthrobacter histidinolovorans TaxID=43664 RepID=A0ABW8MZE6_9MICC
MRPNVTKGTRMIGLIKYLAGPGRHNEHTSMRVITGSETIITVASGEALNAENTIALAHEMDLPKAVFGTSFKTAHVFHVSLSLAADEGGIPDAKWAAIAQDYVTRMGFTGDGGKASSRWVAIHHGTSTGGNDHIHIAVSMIREDGSRWSQHQDLPRTQKACEEIEKTHGLRITYGEFAERGYHPKEKERARAQGAPERDSERLQRAVRAASTASLEEAEFVRRLRRSGVLIRPRYAMDNPEQIVGYSVALKPPTRAERPVWFGGGRLAKDLTLPKLREGWGASPESGPAALLEWQAAATGKRMVTAGREARVPTAEEWQKYTAEVGELYEQIRTAPLDNPALWAQVARETSGAFAAWSIRTEATPGPLAETAKALSRSAQLRRFPPRTEHAPMPSAKGAGMLLMQTAVGPSTVAGHALLLAQLRNTMKAMYDMHHAAGRLHEAERIRVAATDGLATVRSSLQADSNTHKNALTTSSRDATRDPASAPAAAPAAVLEREQAPAQTHETPSGNTTEATQVLDPELQEIQRLAALSFPISVSRPPTGTHLNALTPQPSPNRPRQEKDKGRGR